MKILRLSLNNLASLAGTHHIHFDQQPLAHAGLIAITGKTGAGKSTLLDAMCLALYNEVPRLKGAAGSLKDAGGQEISIKDSKNILRRGTTSGFAELEFMALDAKRYQARWEIRRARNKVDGTLKVDRAITCLDDQKVLNQKISEATPIVEKLIGLSFEQFTRAVLLAQSEVGAFLKAKDHERADLLEYLTNSHIFSLVSIKAAEKNSQIKQQRTELENIIGHINLLSEDEITELQQHHKELSLQLQNLKQAEKLLENEKKWYLERDQLYAEVHGKKEIYDVQLDAVHKSAAQQQLLQQLDKFQTIREQFLQRERLTLQKLDVQKKQSEFHNQFSQLQQHATAAQQSLTQFEQTHEQFEQHRLNIKPHLELGLKLDHDIANITEQYKKLNTEIETFADTRISPLQRQLAQQQSIQFQRNAQRQSLHKTLETTQVLAVYDQEPQSVLKNLQRYIEHYQLVQTQSPESLNIPLNILQQDLKQCNETLQNYQQQYDDLDQLEKQLSSVEEQRQQQQAMLLQLQHQQQNLLQLINQEHEYITLQTRIRTEKNHLKTVEEKINLLNTAINNKDADYVQLEKILLEQRRLHSENVQSLRAQLKENEPCMVCGSLDHPFIEGQHALEQSLIELQEQQLQKAKEELSSLSNELKIHEIEQSKLYTRIEQQQERSEQLKQQIQLQRQTLMLLLEKSNIQLNNDQDLTSIETLIQTKLEQLTFSINSLQAQEKHLHSHIEQWRRLHNQIQQYQLSLQHQMQLEHLIEPIRTLLPESYHTQSPIEWTAKIQQQLQQRMDLLQSDKTLEHELQHIHQQIEQTKYQLTLEQKQVDQLNQTREQLIEQGKQLRQQLTELTEHYAGQSYRIAAEWRNKLEEQAQQHLANLEQQRQRTIQAEQALTQANLEQQRFISQLQHIEQQIDNVQEQIHSWQLSHPSATTEQIQNWLKIDLHQHQQIRQSLTNQQRLLENAKTAWQVLEERYQTHLKQQPEQDLTHLESKLTRLLLDKNTQQERLNALDAQLILNANNQTTYAKYQSQIEQIKAEEYRWGRIYDLIGHREGTKFQKIAQEHHLDILVEYANQQLQPLAPRYQLHRIPDSLSLAIIDLDMNSEIRPVLSLSGGETFLVSLALALAIANMASGSMKLESLFIDEGFGTLDPASLHMVMNALDHLQSQGRKVVLISHVQEMHERIPVQIQVKPIGAGASTIEVVG